MAGFRFFLFHLFQINRLQMLVSMNLLLWNVFGKFDGETLKTLFRGRTADLVGFAGLITGGYTSPRGWDEVAQDPTFLFTRHC